MSRSYRHNPIVKDNKRRSKKWARKQANRRVRHYKLFLPDGSTYKKLYERWDIWDCTGKATLNDWLRWWGNWYIDDDLNSRPWRTRDNYYGKTIQEAKIKWAKEYYWK